MLNSNADIWVADNASTDGSVEMLRTDFPEVKTIAFDINNGFTGGYNKALDIIFKSTEYKYVVLINSDIEVGNGWLEPLEKWMDTHPECGVCGPKLHALGEEYSRTENFEYAGAAGGLIDRLGYPFCRGRVPFRTEKDTGQYPDPCNVLWISGACMMTRVKIWKELGGLDERFFAHMEEIDYCWRVQLAGWQVTVVPESTVWHLGGGTLPQNSPFKLKLNFRNNILLLDNNLKPTFISMGMDEKKAAQKAKQRIKARKLLDFISAFIYLALGRKESYQAVMQAKKETEEMIRERKGEQLARRVPDGLMNVCILSLASLKGKSIFKYLRKYENSHSRCR